MNNPTERARQRLQARRGQYRTICEISGLGYSWITKFGMGVISDPGVARLLKLERALTELDSADSLSSLSSDPSTASQESARGNA